MREHQNSWPAIVFPTLFEDTEEETHAVRSRDRNVGVNM